MQGQERKIVICGAGIAGIAAAYFLTLRGMRNITLVDERAPLSLTSDKSTEAYRNWWPGPDGAMISLMNRSIDLLERLAQESGNRFHLNRRGYLYTTASREGVQQLQKSAALAEEQGAGPVRVHASGHPTPGPLPPDDYAQQNTGADLLLNPNLIQARFPYLSTGIRAALHVRRCGWFSGQQLGMTMLEAARARGARLLQARVEGLDIVDNEIAGVHVRQAAGQQTLPCATFVNAAGPMIKHVAAMMQISLPVFSELHLKASIKDAACIVPREAPLLILNDPQILPWSEEERQFLAQDPETRPLLEGLPGGVHARPEGSGASQDLLMLWPYHTPIMEPHFPIPIDETYPEIVLRGCSTLIPGLQQYLQRMPKPFVDGGYYTKTRENRPLIGPLSVRGAYLIGALSGFGLMSACGAAELLANHILGDELPAYAPAFLPSRYQDPHYLQRLATWKEEGQL